MANAPPRMSRAKKLFFLSPPFCAVALAIVGYTQEPSTAWLVVHSLNVAIQTWATWRWWKWNQVRERALQPDSPPIR